MKSLSAGLSTSGLSAALLANCLLADHCSPPLMRVNWSVSALQTQQTRKVLPWCLCIFKSTHLIIIVKDFPVEVHWFLLFYYWDKPETLHPYVSVIEVHLMYMINNVNLKLTNSHNVVFSPQMRQLAFAIRDPEFEGNFLPHAFWPKALIEGRFRVRN